MLTFLLLLACTAKDQDSGPADTGAPVTTDTSDSAETDSKESGSEDETGEETGGNYCADVPTVTYESFGRGFLTGNCQGCHASTAANRYDAPEEITFDTVDEVWALADMVLAAATPYDGDEPDMPPQGGVTEDDQTRLQWWLRCADPGT